MNPVLTQYLIDAEKGFKSISEDRKKDLKKISNYVNKKLDDEGLVNLIFICTHNSRRSIFCQTMAQVAAHFYGIPGIFCYSGGTDVTTMYPVVGETLQKNGIEVYKLSDGNNPVYSLKYNENEHPIIGFSKKYYAPFNPQDDFAAILTCNEADKSCPDIKTADKRIALPYDDPKVSDGTTEQAKKYEERCLEITTEMLFVFSHVM